MLFWKKKYECIICNNAFGNVDLFFNLVKEKKFMKLSPSQLKKGRQCLRAYAFEYVQGFKPPPSPKQQFGTDVHKQLEMWLSKGKMPDSTPEGQVAKQGIQKNWLPVPSENLLVEKQFEMPWIEDVKMSGFVDCVSLEEIPIVIDHKTTSSLSWAKTEEQLQFDEQALIYSLWAALTYGSERVKARWVYYAASNPKQGPRAPAGAKAVQVEFNVKDRSYVDKIKDLLVFSKKLIWIRKKEIKALSLPPNPHACSAFGGCPHRGTCNLFGPDRIKAYFEKEKF
jgi:hypothetical protein